MSQVTLRTLRLCSLCLSTFFIGVLFISNIFSLNKLDLKHCALTIVNICESIRATDRQPSIDPLVICIICGSHIQEPLKVPRSHLIILHDLFG